MLNTDPITLSDVLGPEELIARASREVDRYTSLLKVEDEIAEYVKQLRNDTSMDTLGTHVDTLAAQAENRHVLEVIRSRLEICSSPDAFFSQNRTIHLSAIKAAENAYRGKTEAIVGKLLQENYGIPANQNGADTLGVSPVDEYAALQMLAEHTIDVLLQEWIDEQPDRDANILSRLYAVLSVRIVDAAQMVNLAQAYAGAVSPETLAFARTELDTAARNAEVIEQRRPAFKRDVSITALIPQATEQGNKRTLADQFSHEKIARAAAHAAAEEYFFMYKDRTEKRRALQESNVNATNLSLRYEDIRGNNTASSSTS